MTQKNNGWPVIVNALVWAALMIATPLIIGEASDGQKETLMLLQIAGWFTVHSVIIDQGRSLREEWTCLRRKFGKNS